MVKMKAIGENANVRRVIIWFAFVNWIIEITYANCLRTFADNESYEKNLSFRTTQIYFWFSKSLWLSFFELCTHPLFMFTFLKIILMYSFTPYFQNQCMFWLSIGLIRRCSTMYDCNCDNDLLETNWCRLNQLHVDISLYGLSQWEKPIP